MRFFFPACSSNAAELLEWSAIFLPGWGDARVYCGSCIVSNLSLRGIASVSAQIVPSWCRQIGITPL